MHIWIVSTFEWIKTYSNHHHIEEKKFKTAQATFTVWLPSVEVCSSEGLWCQICGFFSLTLTVLDKDFELRNHELFLFLPCSCISAHTFYLLPFPFSYPFSFLIPFPLSSFSSSLHLWVSLPCLVFSFWEDKNVMPNWTSRTHFIFLPGTLIFLHKKHE